MNDVNLARVQWRIGQVLTPSHFCALEDSLSAESYAHGAFAGLPAYGLARLVWNATSSIKGVLEVSQVTWITETGIVLDVPGNADIVGPLDLDAVKRPQIDVYLHFVRAPESDQPSPNDPAVSRNIPRVRHQLTLSADYQVKGSVASLLLGQMHKLADQKWKLSDTLIPPLLAVGSTPYLTLQLAELRRSLAELDVRLRHRLLDLHARHKPIRAVQRARIEARKLDVSLADIDHGLHLHPYLVYSWLRAFWLELYLRGERVPDDVIPAASIPAYSHDKLASCFGAVLAGIAQRIQREPLSPPTETRSFKLIGRQLVADNLPSEALQASELYLLVQKPSAEAVVSMDGVRLATPERLSHVTQHSLGVEITRIRQSALVSAFGPWIDFYLVNRSETNPEWLEIKDKRRLALARQERFDGLEMALYWRRAPGGSAP